MGDKMKGKMDEVAGKMKQSAGETMNDQSMANRGTAQQVKGNAEQAWGSVQQAGSDAQAERRKEHEQAAHNTRENITAKARDMKDRVEDNVDRTRNKY